MPGSALFPGAVAAILLVGIGVIVYARATVPSFDAFPPTTNDHWHVAYGFELCDSEEFSQLAGNLESLNSRGQLHSTEFARTGVHSHDDGVIHWHPASSAAIGKRAQLGLFLRNYGVNLDDDSLTFPDDQAGRDYVEGETTCDGKPGELVVDVWDSPEDRAGGKRYVSGFENIPISNDGLIVTIAFVPIGAEVSMPPWARQLRELGAADLGQSRPANPPDTTIASPGGAGGTIPYGGVAPSTLQGADTPGTLAAMGSTVPT